MANVFFKNEFGKYEVMDDAKIIEGFADKQNFIELKVGNKDKQIIITLHESELRLLGFIKPEEVR